MTGHPAVRAFIIIILLYTDDDDDEEYSISAQSILQQQRRRSGGKGRPGRSGRRGGRRPSSPFPGDELSASGGRRRTSRGYSVATISSAEYYYT